MKKLLITLLASIPLFASATQYNITLKNLSSKVLQVQVGGDACFKSVQDFEILNGGEKTLSFNQQGQCNEALQQLVFKAFDSVKPSDTATTITFIHQQANDINYAFFTQQFASNAETVAPGNVIIKKATCSTTNDPNDLLSNHNSVRNCIYSPPMKFANTPVLNATVDLKLGSR